MFCLKSRKVKNIPITGFHKWMIYLIGLAETLLFSCSIFGWPQLAYVLKNDEIYLNLCQNENFIESFNISNESGSSINETIKLRGCPEQDQVFALIYTIGCFGHDGIGIVTGFTLYYFGLVVTRTIFATALVTGFLALGLTNKEQPFWLYVSIILISCGGAGLRNSAFQFCNLFPKWRSTALTVISGSYSASAGLFLIFQIGQQYGISLWKMSYVTATLASVSLFASIIMPWHHIQYDIKEEEKKYKLPFRSSALSISSFSWSYWFYMLMISIRSYSFWFNSWTSHIAKSGDEAAFYSLLYSIGAYLGPIVTPLPGIFNDHLVQKARSENSDRKRRFKKELKVPVFTLAISVLMMMTTFVSLLFDHQVSIYISIVLIQMQRPLLASISNAFLRIRFPPEHFDRFKGFFGTIVALAVPLQYFVLVWSQNNKIAAISVQEILLIVALVHPLHLLSNKYREKIAKERFPHTENDEEKSENFIEVRRSTLVESVKLNDS